MTFVHGETITLITAELLPLRWRLRWLDPDKRRKLVECWLEPAIVTGPLPQLQTRAGYRALFAMPRTWAEAHADAIFQLPEQLSFTVEGQR